MSRKDTMIVQINQCARCQSYDDATSMFEWTNCLHRFCVDCVLDAVNTDFSLLNEIPTCWCKDCDEKLDVAHLMSIPSMMRESLFDQYKGQDNGMNDLVRHDRSELLFAGFVRLSFCRIMFIPNDILNLLHGFFKMTYFMKVDCYHCNGRGHNGAIRRCTVCKGRGLCTNICAQTTKTSKIPKFSAPRNPMIANGKTPQKERQIMVRTKCHHCDGKGCHATPCTDCNASGKMMVLDFKSLRKHQELCVRCNTYFPQDLMLYWSGCNHSICSECTLKYLRDVRSTIVTDNKIPCCPVPDCGHEIGLRTMQELQVFTGKKAEAAMRCFARNELPATIPLRAVDMFETEEDRDIDKKLRELIHNRDDTGFYCAHCHEWHANEEGFSWSGCGHRFGKKCGFQILNLLVPPSPRPITGLWQTNATVVSEPKVPVCEAIVGIYGQNQCSFPLQPKYCCAPLTTEDAAKLGATPRQLAALYRLWNGGQCTEIGCHSHSVGGNLPTVTEGKTEQELWNGVNQCNGWNNI